MVQPLHLLLLEDNEGELTLWLGEHVSTGLLVALGMVAVGIVLVNFKPAD